ncbi:hypothetical protein Hanom_Chr12g01169881 [Helianthus anomalus]
MKTWAGHRQAWLPITHLTNSTLQPQAHRRPSQPLAGAGRNPFISSAFPHSFTFFSLQSVN